MGPERPAPSRWNRVVACNEFVRESDHASPKMRRVLAIAALLAGLALAACGGDDDSDTPAAPEAAAEEEMGASEGTQSGDDKASAGSEKEAAPGVLIEASDSQYGSVLFDGDQQAIYLFDKDDSETSRCYGACAEAWPPVLTKGEPQAGNGIDSKLLGTTERDDGTTQVTYGGHPLYYYVDDPTGEVLCHNVEEFGGLWLAVAPSGDAVQ
jgi:predicted lipoprotein with Yx(FWY)xxD motif